MKPLMHKLVPLILVLIIMIGLIAVDRWAADLPKSRIKQFIGDRDDPVRKPKADLFILGSSTGMWLRNKVFLNEAGISKRQYADGLISGGHYDAHLGMVWNLKEKADPSYKACIVGANYYSFIDDYFNNRSIHHDVFVPTSHIQDMAGYYLSTQDPFMWIGNLAMCKLSKVYCDNKSYSSKLERGIVGFKPKDPLYPWWWSEVTDYYAKNDKPPRKKKKHPRLPRGKLTEDKLVYCLADYETSEFKRRVFSRLLDELDDICGETAVVLLAMPKACRQKEHSEDIPKFDAYFEELTRQKNRTLIDLASVGGELKYFADSVHLIPARAGLYASTLVEQLNPIFDRVGIKRKPVKAEDKKRKTKSKGKKHGKPAGKRKPGKNGKKK